MVGASAALQYPECVASTHTRWPTVRQVPGRGASGGVGASIRTLLPLPSLPLPLLPLLVTPGVYEQPTNNTMLTARIHTIVSRTALDWLRKLRTAQARAVNDLPSFFAGADVLPLATAWPLPLLACDLSFSTSGVFSHVKSMSSRPKCP